MDRYDSTLGELRQLLGTYVRENGGRLPPERDLAERLRVGRRVLRRALATLEAEGLVSRRQGAGTFVTEPREGGANGVAAPPAASLPELSAVPLPGGNWLAQWGNPMELIELRLNIEPIMARLAALRSSQMDAAALRALAQATREAKDAASYQAADLAFHRKLAELSRNALLLTLFESLSGALREEAMQRFGETGHCFKRQASHATFHEAIVEAVAKHDCELAERLMQDHLADVHRSLFAPTLPAGYWQWRETRAD